MCISLKRHIASLLLLCLPLVVVGCGGGGGGGGSTVAVSGVAAKGPIAGGAVTVHRLLENGTRGDVVGSGTTGADGSYSVGIPAGVTGPLVITVAGKPGATYTSESTGLPVPFSASESFSAAVDSFTPGVGIAVTPLTDLAFDKLPAILAEKPGTLSAEKLQSSIVAANNLIGNLFNISDILAPPSAGSSYQAVLTVVDQMVVDSKAGGTITDTSAVMSVLNQAIIAIDPAAPAYQTFLSVFTAAAEQVQADNPGAVATLVAGIVTQATNPPAEPDFTDVTAPTAVAGVNATASAVSATISSVSLTWAASSDANGVAGYDVYRDGSKIGTSVTTAFTDASVAPNVTYAYTVVAFDAAGNRAGASAAVSVRPVAPSLSVTVSGQLGSDVLALPEKDIFAPTAPTGLSAVTAAIDATTSSVTLSWSAATDAVAVTGYEVFRGGVKIATVAATTYTDPSVTSGTAYSYTVKALDAAGNRSASSAALSVTPNQASLGVTIGGQVTTN